MDTITHALLGALAARAVLAVPQRSGFERQSLKHPSLVGGLAAAFPDLDYLSFWIEPLTFLAECHQGPTHSLIMLPIWALFLGIVLATLSRNAGRWRAYAGVCGLGLLSHIASDLITVFGTQILWPISALRVSFGTTFVVDPYFSALVLSGLIASSLASRSLSARIGLLMILGYLGLQLTLKGQARDIGDDYLRNKVRHPASMHVLPQPLSPFNWLIIVDEGGRYHIARVNLLSKEQNPVLPAEAGWLARLWAAYGSSSMLRWDIRERYGNEINQQSLAKAIWDAPAFSSFRRFARYPVLYRIDRVGEERCVWFTDLRYVLPGLIPPFRYGMCGQGAVDDWGLYRLRRFTQNDRHYLDD